MFSNLYYFEKNIKNNIKGAVLHLFSFKTPFVLRLNNKIYKYYIVYI